MTEEEKRLQEARESKAPWKKWGPYLTERQWGTVREDYSDSGDAWDYFTHDQARSRAYRWGEDGLAGISDDQQHLCFALALWNGKDPILKERLFGLTNSEGEPRRGREGILLLPRQTPTHSYMKYLYKYPQAAYPYDDLVATNRQRTRNEMEYELLDTGVFDDDRYFDVFVEYAKGSPEDMLIRITVCNRGPEPASCTCCPRSGSATTGRRGLPDLPRNRRSSRSRDRRVRARLQRCIPYWVAYYLYCRGRRCPCSSPRTRRTTSGSFQANRTTAPMSRTASTTSWYTGKQEAVNPDRSRNESRQPIIGSPSEPGKSEVIRLRLTTVPSADAGGNAVRQAL